MLGHRQLDQNMFLRRTFAGRGIILARQAVAATAEAEARIVAVDLQVTQDEGCACTRTAAVADY